MSIYSIYRITNSINGKVYIGQSKNPERRFRGHCRKIDSVISRAIAKYGASNFTMEVIYQTTDVNDVDWAERHFIQEHASMVEFGGYNVEPGGQVNKNMSETSKQKISLALKGRKHSAEHRANGAKSRTGRKATEEHKNNIRLAAARNRENRGLPPKLPKIPREKLPREKYVYSRKPIDENIRSMMDAVRSMPSPKLRLDGNRLILV